jgi:hypothetical protein
VQQNRVGTSNITASLSGVTSPVDVLTVTAATLTDRTPRRNHLVESTIGRALTRDHVWPHDRAWSENMGGGEALLEMAFGTRSHGSGSKAIAAWRLEAIHKTGTREPPQLSLPLASKMLNSARSEIC